MKSEISFLALAVQLELTWAAQFLRNHRIIGRCSGRLAESPSYKVGKIFAQMTYPELKKVSLGGQFLTYAVELSGSCDSGSESKNPSSIFGPPLSTES